MEIVGFVDEERLNGNGVIEEVNNNNINNHSHCSVSFRVYR